MDEAVIIAPVADLALEIAQARWPATTYSCERAMRRAEDSGMAYSAAGISAAEGPPAEQRFFGLHGLQLASKKIDQRALGMALVPARTEMTSA